MPFEPGSKRVIAFIDGQNLFFAAKAAFGYNHPNYDPLALARRVTESRGWDLVGVSFYTGVPARSDNPRWSAFWAEKLGFMGTRGVRTFSRTLRYRTQVVTLPDGSVTKIRVGQEKGIDVRLALDAVRLAREDAYDVALVFSQDQDLSEVADEIRAVSRAFGRWIKIASAFPVSDLARTNRGIDKTDWIPIDRALYDSCLDPHDYRPRLES
ncbi:MAG: NYN domain-containing protein [Candidatus Eisenbacteria bacterium]|nr:NYN domain-containing protein [Candidatus Eisenbacteria bacterium]